MARVNAMDHEGHGGAAAAGDKRKVDCALGCSADAGRGAKTRKVIKCVGCGSTKHMVTISSDKDQHDKPHQNHQHSRVVG
jgi:hypothetical protein